MKLSRRRFIQRGGAFSAATLISLPAIIRADSCCGPAAFKTAEATDPVSRSLKTDQYTFEPLRGDVGFFRCKGGTIGWLATADAFVVVDAQMTETANLFWDDFPARPERKVDVFINTHHHHDHTGGNGVLAPHSKLHVAQKNVPDLQRAAAVAKGSDENEVYASTLFENEWRLDVGSEILNLTYYPHAHTNGDSITLFEKANVVHMGDLVFNRNPPYIDRKAGAGIANWATHLENIHDRFDDDTRFIFGHAGGDWPVHGKRQDLLQMRDYLTGLLEYVGKQVKAGMTREQLGEIDAVPGFSEYDHERTKGWTALALVTAYDEVTEGTPAI